MRIGEYERRFLRPRRAKLDELAEAIAYRGRDPGAAVWARAIEAGRIPASWADDPKRRFRATKGELRPFPGQLARAAPAQDAVGRAHLLLPTPPTARAALLFAADPEGLIRAEALARTVVDRLADWGCPQASRVAWRLAGNPEDRAEAGGPPLAALGSALAALRAVLHGVGRMFEPAHPHRRFQFVVDLVSWQRCWQTIVECPIPREARGPEGPVELPAALVGKKIGELPNPLLPWLELIETGYWLWAVTGREQGEPGLELAAPFPPPREGRPDKRAPVFGPSTAPRAVWSQRLSKLRVACVRGEAGQLRRELPELADETLEVDQPRLIHFAAYGGSEVIEVLAEHGRLELEARDRDGRTALMLAAGLPTAGPVGANPVEIDVPISEIVGAAACAALLGREPPAETDARDLRGLTALHWAALGRRLRCADELLRAGAAVDPRDHLGRTPLMLALAQGAPSELIELLLAAGADADARDHQGWTPLHYLAARDGGRRRRAIQRELGKRGARASRDRAGRTPAQLCALQGVEVDDGGPLDPRAPVAAGPGLRPRFELEVAGAEQLIATLLDGLVPPPADPPSWGADGPRAALDAWSVWADMLLGAGDARGELVATSLARIRVGRRPRRRLLQALRALELRLQAPREASLYAADPFALLRRSPIELRWTHGFVTGARLSELAWRRTAPALGAERVAGTLAEGTRWLLRGEPLLADLQLAVEQPTSWAIVLAGLRALEPAPNLRRLSLARLPLDAPTLAELGERLPAVHSLNLIGAGKLRSLALDWPGLRALRLRHGDTSEWTRGGVDFELKLPDLTHLDLALPAGGRTGQDEVEGFARTLAGLPPSLVHLRLQAVARRFFLALIESGAAKRLRSLSLARVRGRTLEQIVAHADALAGLERLEVEVSAVVARQRAATVGQLREIFGETLTLTARSRTDPGAS